MSRIGVITNPTSRKNRSRTERADRLRTLVEPFGRVIRTENTGEIAPALESFSADGIDTWVSDGGDGTLHWLLNEGLQVFGEQIFDKVMVTPTNGGTIDFVARKAGIRGHAEEICTELVDRAATSRPCATVRVDSLHLEGVRVGADGKDEPFEMMGFAVAAAGVAQAFFDRYYSYDDPHAPTIVAEISKMAATIYADKLVPRPLRPWFAWPCRTAATQFPKIKAKVVLDGEPVEGRELAAICAGSIDISLGGVVKCFHLAREAGRLHFILGDAAPHQIVAEIPNMLLGRPLTRSGLTETSGKHLTVECLGDQLLEPVVDGEIYRGVRYLEVRPGPRVRLPVTV